MSAEASEAPAHRYSLRTRTKPVGDHTDSASSPALPASSPPSNKKAVPKSKSYKTAGAIVKDEVSESPGALGQMSKLNLVSPTKSGAPAKPVIGKRKRGGTINAGNVSEHTTEKPTEPGADSTASQQLQLRWNQVAFNLILSSIERANACHKCKTKLLSDDFADAHVETWTSVVTRHPGTPLSGLACPSVACDGTTCLGCGKAIARDDTRFIGFCCAKGWYAAVWILLCYFDSKRGREDIMPSSKPAQPPKQAKTTKKGKAFKARRGPNPKPPAGTGYSENYHDATWGTPPDGQTASETKTRQRNDEREARIFQLLTNLMKNKPESTGLEPSAPTRKAKKQKKPPKTASEAAENACLLHVLFQWSKVPKVIAELFRNGSIQEAHERSGIYQAAMDLVESMARRDDVAEIVKSRTFDAFRFTSQSCRGTVLPNLCVGDGAGYDLEHLEGISIASAIGELVLAAGAQVDAAAAMPSIFDDKSSKDLLSFCRRVGEVGAMLGHSKKPSAAKSEGQKDVGQPARFSMVEDANFLKAYRYAQKAAGYKQATAPKRMRALFHEMGVLRTSLPEGIFVRVASDRPDMLKAIIVGGEGTPYEGGLFEFHLLCPQDYPNSPPSVTCATAARPEAIRFHLNPNLYNSGYVCLSLIGTWQGNPDESWQPGRSTLLQVLISIHSMILGTATPADNEPGGMHVPHKDYNQEVQAGTISAAMLGWLQIDELRNGTWKEVVEYHFKHNAAKILETTKGWAKNNNRIVKHVEHVFPGASSSDLVNAMLTEADSLDDDFGPLTGASSSSPSQQVPGSSGGNGPAQPPPPFGPFGMPQPPNTTIPSWATHTSPLPPPGPASASAPAVGPAPAAAAAPAPAPVPAPAPASALAFASDTILPWGVTPADMELILGGGVSHGSGKRAVEQPKAKTLNLFDQLEKALKDFL